VRNVSAKLVRKIKTHILCPVGFSPQLLLLLSLFVNYNWVDTRWQQYSKHLHTNNSQNPENGTYITLSKIGKCGPCPVVASYTLAFALQLRNKHGKTSVRVVEKCPDIPVAAVQYTFTHTIHRTTQGDRTHRMEHT
jgi:hypothetical protein